MASFNIHLAIAKRYIEKVALANTKEFYEGIIEPDLAEDKKMSHYSGNQNKGDLLKYLENKVQLNLFLKNNDISSSYQKGVFLHLITDYLFFNNFFDNEYLKNISYEEFMKDLYYSYDLVNEYLEDNYNVDCMNFVVKIKDMIEKDKEEKNSNNEKRDNILPIDKIDKFIEYVSNVSIEDYRNKILKANRNILP